MLKKEIENLRNLLNQSIEGEEDCTMIYKLSTKLDELIVNYYRQCGQTNT